VIRSMTGFGDAAATVQGVHYFVEARSLNSRYFKAVVRLPEEFQGLEAEIEAELRQRLRRGSVVCVVQINDASESVAYSINHKALTGYIAQLKQAEQIKSGEVSIEIGPLLSLPGVLQPPANEEFRIERTRAALKPLLIKAMDGLLNMRAREGDAVKAELETQRDVMARELVKVEGRAPQVAKDYEVRLKQRVENMFKDAAMVANPVDLIREIAVFSERADIREEIQRLGGHIKQFSELLAVSDDRQVGRTMDFLTQEMLREANTMGSKSGDSDISRAVVEIKGAIDRIKEQVQNIE